MKPDIVPVTPLAAICLWLLTCSFVAAGLDALATRPETVYVEDYRAMGMSDKQVVHVAVQQATRVDKNWWWIRSGKTRLVFESGRVYRIEPDDYDPFGLDVVGLTSSSPTHTRVSNPDPFAIPR